MRIFKNRWFTKFSRKEDISDDKICDAVKDVEQDNIDADYGGGVIKQRISRRGEGKSGGYRAIICFRKAERAFFVYGFAKGGQSNLDEQEVKVYKKLAKQLFALSDDEIEKHLKNETLTEVKCGE